MDNKEFSFAKPFKVFIDDEELENVIIVQITRDCSKNDETSQNISTLYYLVNGQERVLTLGLEAISFVNA